MAESTGNGRIVKVAGPVVDIEFPPGELPEILFAVEIDFELGGEQKKVWPRSPSTWARARCGPSPWPPPTA
jgi:hypothetical protein